MSRATNNIGWAGAITVAGFAFAIVPEVVADTVLFMDINDFTLTNTTATAFSSTFSGTLDISATGGGTPTVLFGMQIQTGGTFDLTTGTYSTNPTSNVDITPAGSWSVSAFVGSIIFDSGVIIGGDLTISLFDGATTNTFMADFSQLTALGASSSITGPNLGDFEIRAALVSGFFDGSTFGGADISDFFPGTFSGSAFNFMFTPETDTASQSEIFLLVPAPLAAPWGLAGLIGVIVARRRRNKRRVAA